MIELPLYCGDSLRSGVQSSLPLIQDVLWEDDFVMLLGSEKAGKSILAMQMAFSLTTGAPFLDKYEIPSTCQVLYIQAEGKRSDFVDRMNQMADTVALDDSKFAHLPKKFLPLDVPEYFDALVASIDAMLVKPRVIFIDPLYMAMSGDLIENQDARRFLSAIAFLMDRYKCSIVLVHHETKEVFFEGQHTERGDKGAYGSVFFRAIVDHILYLKKSRDGTRVLSCDTQRSGKVFKAEELILIEPSPLCFEIKGDYKAYEEIVRLNIAKTPDIDRAGLIAATSLSASAIDKALRHLAHDNIITKNGTTPQTYTCQKRLP